MGLEKKKTRFCARKWFFFKRTLRGLVWHQGQLEIKRGKSIVFDENREKAGKTQKGTRPGFGEGKLKKRKKRKTKKKAGLEKGGGGRNRKK